MSRSPRAEALSLLQTGQPIQPPLDTPAVPPNSPEALEYVDSLKEEHFAVLAKVTDRLFEHALENRQPDDRKLLLSKHYPYDKWRSLADSWREELLAARDAISSTPLYRDADRFAAITGTFNTARHLSLDTKLDAGIGTGITTTLTLLRNVPQIVRYHRATDEAVDLGAISRHPASLRLIRPLAKQSINQVLAAQTALEGKCQPSSWAGLDHTVKPHHFTLRHYADKSVSLDYADFADLTVPAGYKPHEPMRVVTEPTRAKDIPSQQSKTIGCPITLVQQRLGQLWQWGVDLVETNELWEEEWPPQLSRAGLVQVAPCQR
jgi:hypothetical protein